MIPGGNRKKGQRGEREVIKILQPLINATYEQKGLTPPKLKRNTNQCDGGGYDISALPFFAIEVKRCESLSIKRWWKQTIQQANDREKLIPVLMYRQNHLAWNCMILDDNNVPKIINLSMFCEWFTSKLNKLLSY